MIRRAAIVSLWLLAAGCAREAADAPAAEPVPDGAWIVDDARSSLTFRSVQAGATFNGRFRKFHADIAFDPDDLEAASVTVTIDMASAETGDRQRDIALPGEDWFATRRHPAAQFSASQFQRIAAGDYEAKGVLSIRELSHPLTLPFTLELDGDTARARGAVTIIRTDFGVGRGDFATDEWVDLDVVVEFDIAAQKR